MPARSAPAPSSTRPALLAIGRITRALDGIPLAVELAAARAGAMSPAEIADRLDHRFALLTSGSRTAEARQQTLRATVDWSYALLSERRAAVFNRLSVFQGGWTMDAAEAVVDRRRRTRRVRARDHRPARSSGPWSSSSPAHPPGTGCWRRCASTPPNGSRDRG